VIAKAEARAAASATLSTGQQLQSSIFTAGEATATGDLTTQAALNHPPVVQTIPDIVFFEGIPAQVDLHQYASDPDGDPLTVLLTGCPQNVASNAIRNAAIKLCEETRCWVYEHPEIPYVVNQPGYTLSPPSGTKVHEILFMWDSATNRTLYPKSVDRMNRLYLNWRTQKSLQPLYYTDLDLDANTMRIAPYPDTGTTGGAQLIVFLATTEAMVGEGATD
jgi:hypothetical protein